MAAGIRAAAVLVVAQLFTQRAAWSGEPPADTSQPEATASDAAPAQDDPAAEIKAAAAAAQRPTEPVVPIESIDLTEMLNATVVTASKEQERMGDSPAIISVVTAQQIQEMGADTLYDVLATVPGVEIYETYYGYTSVTFRGILQTHYNDKSLMLINGHPIYDTVNTSWYLEAIPVGAIERIEVIRGPGSTLYGTNAFAGVINIITKDGKTPGATSAHVTMGRFDTLDAGMSLGGTRDDGFTYFLAAQYRNSDGYPFKVIKDEEGKSGKPSYPDDPKSYEDDYYNAYGQVSWGDVKLSAVYFSMEKDKMGIVPALVGTGERHLQGLGADLRFEHKFLDKVDVAAMLYYDYFQKSEYLAWYPPASSRRDNVDATGAPAPIGGPEYQDFSGQKTGAELRASGAVNDWLNIQGGVVFERTEADHYTNLFARDSATHQAGDSNPTSNAIASAKETQDVAAFAQVSLRPLDNLRLDAGLRFNRNEDFGNFIAPRAAAVFRATDALSLKLLYGRAYRAPNLFEKFVSTQNVLYGGDIQAHEPIAPEFPLQQAYTLKPEVIDSFEAAAELRLLRHSLLLNLFMLNTRDMIERNRSAATVAANGSFTADRPTPQYGNNSEGYQVVGAEVEVRGVLLGDSTYFVNLSTRYAYDESLDDKLSWRTPIIGNAGVTLHAPDPVHGLSLTTYLTAVGPRSGKLIDGRDKNLFPDVSVELDPYFLWNATLSYQLTQHVRLALLAHNLLNERYQYPEYIRARGPTVPGGPPRAVYGRVTLTY